MLDKLKFNNLVITHKKRILLARSQTVQKFHQKLRKFKSDLEKHPDKSKKINDGIRKNAACMEQLKSFKCLEMIRRLLLLEGTNLQAVVTNGRSTPDELALAMLAQNKIIVELLVTFRKDLKLSTEATAKWREEILETSKRRVKLERTEEKKKRRKELKEQKAQTKNRLDWLEQNKVPEVEQAVKKKEQETQAEQTTKPERQKKKIEKVKPPKKLDRVKPVKKQREKAMLPNPAEEQRAKETLPQAKQRKRKPLEEPKDQRPTHVIDPFFITETGQPYLSTAVVLSEDNQSDSDAEEQPPAFKRRVPRTENPSTDDRHPSWLAKQQQKPIISNFKGKKIKFGENGDVATVVVAAAADPPAASTEGMHPSWIAKQKLKPKIASFQGTKIKFNDD